MMQVKLSKLLIMTRISDANVLVILFLQRPRQNRDENIICKVYFSKPDNHYTNVSYLKLNLVLNRIRT